MTLELSIAPGLEVALWNLIVIMMVAEKLHDDSWWWLHREMVMLSGVGWLEGGFAALCFSSGFVVSLLIYCICSALSVCRTFKRESCRCRLQCFRNSVVCSVARMREVSLGGELVYSVYAALTSKDLIQLQWAPSSLHWERDKCMHTRTHRACPCMWY